MTEALCRAHGRRKFWKLAGVVDRIADLPQACLHEFLPWHRKACRQQALAA